MPCSYCSSRQLSCLMVEDVSRCQECVRRGRSCDGSGVSLAILQKTIAESDRLRNEEEKAEQDLSMVLARLERIRQQRKFHRDRVAKMVKRGLQSLEELEEAERSEAPEQNTESRDSSSTVPSLPIEFDWSGVDLGSPSWLVDPTLSAWVDQGVGGEIARSPPGPSQGAS
ncbi:hypothetical protein F5Y17DRAFT_453661 [Xylariaceae sp. FL0594]|nr:hypothetical protein F5Y17DRAFT_453661 [Xylariaceae sp. FL0594]